MIRTALAWSEEVDALHDHTEHPSDGGQYGEDDDDPGEHAVVLGALHDAIEHGALVPVSTLLVEDAVSFP